MCCLFISISHSTDKTSSQNPTSQHHNSLQETQLDICAKILTKNIEAQLNDKRRTVRENDRSAMQYAKEDFSYLKMMLPQKYQIQNPEERLLRKILEIVPGDQKGWMFFAQYYAFGGYNVDYLLQLFETKAGVDPSYKFELLAVISTLVCYEGIQKDLTSYMVGMIRKKEIPAKEICSWLVCLTHDILSESDWLAIVDAVFTEPESYHKLKQNKTDREFKDFLLKYIDTVQMEIKLRQDMERVDRCPRTAGHLNALKLLKELDEMLYYPAVCEVMRDVLKKIERSFMTDMSLIQHLSQRFHQERSIRNILLDRWLDQLGQRDTSLSVTQFGILMNQFENISKFDRVQTLLHQGNHPVKPYGLLEERTIYIVSSEEPRGDGVNPETFDYYCGTQYPSMSLYVPELRKRGYQVKVLNWEDPTIIWEDYPVLFFLMAWGYPKKLEKLEEWLSRIKSAGIPMVNSMDFVEWNIYKTYLLDLQNEGVPVIPTMVVSSDSPLTILQILEQAQEKFGTMDIILKGVVDAGGGGYFHYKPENHEQACQHLEKLKANNRGALVQPFWPEVSEKGEISFVFYGNALSHSYLKVPKKGSELVQRFYESYTGHISKKDLSIYLEEFFQDLLKFRPDLKLTKEELLAAHRTIFKVYNSVHKLLSDRNILMPPISRLDCVMKNNRLYLMEIEGMPYLEIGEAQKNNPMDPFVEWIVEELIRQDSIAAARRGSL